MHFPLAGAPQQIVSATMRFYVDNFRSFWVDHIEATVNNDVALWEIEAPQSRVFTFWDGSGTIHAGWIEADVTAVVRQDLDTGRAFTGFNFQGQSGNVYLSESGEFGPSLTIIPVPEPSSLVGLIIGLGSATAIRRRRRGEGIPFCCSMANALNRASHRFGNHDKQGIVWLKDQ